MRRRGCDPERRATSLAPRGQPAPGRTVDGTGDTLDDVAGDATHPGTPDRSAHAAARAPGGAAAVIGPGSPLRRVEQFVLLECIGAGGMGAVFAAFDDKLERK